jgi:hypothetical protein
MITVFWDIMPYRNVRGRSTVSIFMVEEYTVRENGWENGAVTMTGLKGTSGPKNGLFVRANTERHFFILL